MHPHLHRGYLSSAFDDHNLPLASSLPFRSSVLAVFQRASGEVLVLERNDTPGAWQFPQGGIEKQETPLKALHREMEEELGCTDIEVLFSPPKIISYTFPADLGVPICQHYCGQSSRWFLCRFHQDQGPKLHQATDAEFRDHRWVPPQDVVPGVVAWKKQAYIQGLKALKLI